MCKFRLSDSSSMISVPCLGARNNQTRFLFLVSPVKRGLFALRAVFVLAFWVDSRIHAHTRVVLQYVFLARSSSSSSSKFTAKANSSFVVFASWLGSLLGGVTRLFRYFLGSVSHSGSLYHSRFSALDTNPSRLARCAGLSSVGTCRQITSTGSLVFCKRLTTNCL